MQSYEDGRLFDANSLFKRICDNVDKVLGATKESIYGAINTYPRNWDYSDKNKSLNTQLMQPFLIQFICLLKPKVIICQGGSWLDPITDEGFKNKEVLQNVFVTDFPSLDVLKRAPKRKKEVWKKILDLQKVFEGNNQKND